MNEFGEIGIDNELVVRTSEDMVELSNGCICCSINGELLDAVERILERPNGVEYLVVETTGLADPLPVAMTFLGSELRDQTRLDSIITLVDAENFGSEILTSEVGRSQVIYGDILMLNKTDLVEESRIVALENELREIKKDARILRSVKGEVPLPLLLSVGLFESDRVVLPAPRIRASITATAITTTDIAAMTMTMTMTMDTITIMDTGITTTTGTVTTTTVTTMTTAMTMALPTTSRLRGSHRCHSQALALSI